MTIAEIRELPTTHTLIVGDSSDTFHESVCRAYHVLEKVKDFLRRGVPVDVILDLIAEMTEEKSE